MIEIVDSGGWMTRKIKMTIKIRIRKK